MKGIPADDLVYMLNATFSGAPDSVITKNFIAKLFDVYGDDYYRDPGESPWELCDKNEARKSYMKGAGESK